MKCQGHDGKLDPCLLPIEAAELNAGLLCIHRKMENAVVDKHGS